MVSNEKIIAAMLSNNSIRSAAKAADVSESTIHAKLRDRDFVKQLQERRLSMLEEAVNLIQNKLLEAVEVIADLMHDEKAPPQARLAAAESLIKHTRELTDQRNRSECRLEPQPDIFNL